MVKGHNKKTAHWSVSADCENINEILYYIFVRSDDGYKFHIVPSIILSEYIISYHNSFMAKHPSGNSMTDVIREFNDKPSEHQPNKIENEYLDRWDLIK